VKGCRVAVSALTINPDDQLAEVLSLQHADENLRRLFKPSTNQDVPAVQASVTIRKIAHTTTSVGDRVQSSRRPFGAGPSLGLISGANGQPMAADRAN
jgi:hypothetical protein